MNAPKILNWCRTHNVQLVTNGDRLRWSAPKGTVSAEFTEALRRHKTELLQILSPERSSTPFADPGLGGQVEQRSLAVVELNDCQPLVPPRVATRTWPRPRSWVTGQSLEALPEVFQGLVCEREGWSPDSWSEYLVFKARACRAFHPELADRYEEAARRLCHGG